MALYTRDSVERVRDAVDFVEIVAARTELRRAGKGYEGLCPFHDERTPSFGIDPDQKVYFCFGCEAAGDLFTFVRETEGLDFRGALELLADRYGVQLDAEREDPREAQRRRARERLLELLARASAFYQRCLWESTEAEPARSYLQERGLGEEVLRQFSVGYAPSARARLLEASAQAGFSDVEVLDAGLARHDRTGPGLTDWFRGRIMFPLHDLRGRAIGFGGRAVGIEQRPKYLNSPEGTVYRKGQHLYGAHLARGHATRAGRVILVEGYTDVLALHQAGMGNTVGLMGTALSDAQISELARMASTVLLALDADSAGHSAMLRASRAAAQRKVELEVVPIPAGVDPAELAQREGAHRLETVFSTPVPFARFHVERILSESTLETPEGRDHALDGLRPVFATLPPSAMRLELTRLVAGRLELPQALAEQILDSGDAPQPRVGDTRHSRAASRALDRGQAIERALLALCIALPDEGSQVLGGLDVDEHFAGELRGAAEALRGGDLRDPLAAAGSDDGETPLARTLAGLVAQAAREPATAARLEAQHRQLRLSAIERRLAGARALNASSQAELAARRQAAKDAFDAAYARVLDEPEPPGGSAVVSPGSGGGR
jgi:DNA primase